MLGAFAIALAAAAPADITGTLVDGAGAPVEGVRVRAFREDVEWWSDLAVGASDRTDDGGRFELEVAAEERFMLVAEAGGAGRSRTFALLRDVRGDSDGVGLALAPGASVTVQGLNRVDGAELTLTRPRASWPSRRMRPFLRTATMSEGTGVLEDVAPGPWNLRVDRGFGFVVDLPIDVVAGEDLEVSAPEPAEGSLHGRVVDGAGAPIAGAAVFLRATHGFTFELRPDATTGDDGRFLVEALAVGEWQFCLRMPGAPAPTPARWVTVRDGETTELRSVVPASPATLTVRLTDTPSPLPPGFELGLRRLDDHFLVDRESFDVSLDGVASGALTAGEWRVSVRPPDAYEGALPASLDVKLGAGRSHEVTLSLAPAVARIRGELEAAAGRGVRWRSADGAASDFTEADERGAFELTVPAGRPGRLDLAAATLPGCDSMAMDVEVPSLGADRSEATTIDLSAALRGAQVVPVDSAGAPLRDVRVELFRASARGEHGTVMRPLRTDGEGAHWLSVSPGPCVALVGGVPDAVLHRRIGGVFGRSRERAFDERRPAPARSLVALDVGAQGVTRVEAPCPRGARLEGAVVDAHGRAVHRATVRILDGPGRALDAPLVLHTDAEGRFHARGLAPGEATVEVDFASRTAEATLTLAPGVQQATVRLE